MMNRVDPDLFAACFRSFVAKRLPGKVDQIAIDGKMSSGKTSRRSHDQGKGQVALHLVSAYAVSHNLTWVSGHQPYKDGPKFKSIKTGGGLKH